jgi:hypothetical protein
MLNFVGEYFSSRSMKNKDKLYVDATFHFLFLSAIQARFGILTLVSGGGPSGDPRKTLRFSLFSFFTFIWLVWRSAV